MCVGFWKRSKFRPDVITHPLLPLGHAVLAACFAQPSGKGVPPSCKSVPNANLLVDTDPHCAHLSQVHRLYLFCLSVSYSGVAYTLRFTLLYKKEVRKENP
jgi:hypothetical protein